jgi:glycosyltransferase involved in cell wall biosynthesis
MRGIGATVINFINSLSKQDKANNYFVFIAYRGVEIGGIISDLIGTDGLQYEIIYIDNKPNQTSTEAPPRKLLRAMRVPRNLFKLWEYYRGNDNLTHTNDFDVYIQFDQQQSVPRIRHTKKILVVYDIIPYVLEWEYLYSYRTARLHEHSRKGSIYIALQRWTYITKLRFSIKRSDVVIAISNKTKDDITKYARAEPRKISVIPLGIQRHLAVNEMSTLQLTNFVQSSWGYVKRPLSIDLSKTQYVLFVGGADKRRKLSDLVAAFNIVRAQGHDLKLVLVGDIMQGPENIPITETRHALETSSYVNDIVYMGFVTDDERHLLYSNALAFIYPSTYEGFGLPVLEAMGFGCPVICYDNHAIREAAGNLPLYALDALSIADHIKDVLYHNEKYTSHSYRTKLINHANKRTWDDVSKDIIDLARSTSS